LRWHSIDLRRDEQAFLGIKEDRAGGDDAVRPAFPANPGGLAATDWSMYRLHQTLIGLRRRNSWLHESRTKILHLSNARVTYEARRGTEHLVVALNLDDATGIQPAPRMRHLLAGDGTLSRAGAIDARITLPGHSWAILTGGQGPA
jgi:cyclomaltodextrinase